MNKRLSHEDLVKISALQCQDLRAEALPLLVAEIMALQNEARRPDENRRPKVGVGVFVTRGNSVLMGLRKGSHGAGTWSIPSGLVEADEIVQDAGTRELYEETGILTGNMRRLRVPSQLRFFNKNGALQGYVTLYTYTSVPESWEARVLEPEKCAEWRWVSMDLESEWPGPLFECLADGLLAVSVKNPHQLGMWLETA